MHSDTIIIARWYRFWRQCCIAYRKGATEDLEGELSRKADALSVRGIWLGHTDDSDEHIIMTPEGVITARTIVRLEPDKRADRDLLMNCKGVPWSTSTVVGKPLGSRAPLTPSGLPAPSTPGTPAPGTPRPPASEPPAAPAAPSGPASAETAAQTADPVLSATGAQTVDPTLAATASQTVVPDRVVAPGDLKRSATTEFDVAPDSSRPRVNASIIQNLDDAATTEDMVSLMPETGPPSHSIDPIVHAAELKVGTDLALEKLRGNEVYLDTPTSEAEGGKYVDCRWENRWVWDGTSWVVKCRWVAREFKWKAWRDDLYCAGSSPECNRFIDALALKEDVYTFELDVVDAYYTAPETELCWVKPPPEYLDMREADGLSRDIVWRLLRQLPGRRAAGKEFNSYLVKSVEECGGEQCPQAPQFFKVGTLHKDLVGIEVHQDDAHGFGSWDAIVRFVQTLKAKVKLKGGEPLDYGVSYAHLKRVRVHEKDRTLIFPNSKYLDTALSLLGLDGCKPAPTPSTPTFREDVHGTEPADEQDGAIYRSALGSLLFYTLRRSGCPVRDEHTGAGAQESYGGGIRRFEAISPLPYRHPRACYRTQTTS